MDIRHVFIFAIMAMAAFPTVVTSGDGCLPCSETKCLPLPSNCKNGTILDRCGCCKLCISVVIQKCTAIKSEDSNDPLCKWLRSHSLINGLPKPYVLEMHSKNPFLSDKPHSFTSKSAQSLNELDNINYDKRFMKVLNKRNKRNVPQESFVDWGQKIGGAIGGNVAGGLASLADMPMKANLDTDFQFQNMPNERTGLYQFQVPEVPKNEKVAYKMFGGLVADVASGIGASIMSNIGNIFSSVLNSILQTPMKGNAEGNIHVENKPTKPTVSSRHKRQAIAYWVDQSGRVVHDPNAWKYMKVSRKYIPIRYSRTLWPSLDTLGQILRYLRDGIFGFLKGTFGCIMDSVSEFTAQQGTFRSGRVYGSHRYKRSSDINDLLQLTFGVSEQKDSSLSPSATEHGRNKRAIHISVMGILGEQIGRVTCHIATRILRSMTNYIFEMLSYWVSSLINVIMPKQSHRTDSWIRPQGFGRSRRFSRIGNAEQLGGSRNFYTGPYRDKRSLDINVYKSFLPTLRHRRSLTDTDKAPEVISYRNEEFSQTKEIENIFKRSINDEQTEEHLIINLPNDALLSNRKAAKDFSEVLAVGLKNIYGDLIGTNLIKRATNGDLAPHVQQLCDALLYNNAELLSYITNNILIDISNASSSLGSQNLINKKLLESSIELSEEGTKAYSAAMIAINALTAPNVELDFEELLSTVQDDAQHLLRELFKTELLQAILTSELTQVISKVTIPFIKFLGEVLKGLSRILTDLSYDYTLNKTSPQQPNLPHANVTSMLDTLLDKILTVTDPSVAETIYHATQALLLEEINYVAEKIRDDGFLGSAINMKYLSKVPKLAHKFGKIIVEKFSGVLKIIILSSHKVALHVKNKDYLTVNYTSRVMAEIPNINKAATLLQQFLNDVGKGSVTILEDILQHDFVSNKMNRVVTKLLLEKAHSLRRKGGKILVFLMEILLEMLDYKITGSKDILDGFLSSDLMTLAYSALHSLDGALSNKNSPELQKLGLLGEKALAQLTSSALARSLFDIKFLEYLSNTMHLYGRTINKIIGHAIYKGFNKIQHKYMKRINLSDIEARHEHIIKDFIKSFTSETNIQSLKKLVKLTAINVGAVTSNLLKSELVNHVINNETAVQLSQFALQSAYSLGDMLAAVTEQVFDGIHILTGGEKQTGIHRSKRHSGGILQSMSDVADQGFIAIMKGLNFLTSPQAVKWIDKVIVLIFKAVAKIIHFIANMNMAKRFLTQNVLNSIMKFAKYLGENGGRLLSAAIRSVLNYIHTTTASSAAVKAKISWGKVGSAAKQGLEMVGRLVSSITSTENRRIIKDFIHILSVGLADITQAVLKSKLVIRIVGRSLSNVFKDLVINTGNIGAWLLEINMQLIHYFLELIGFNNNAAQHTKIPNVRSILRSVVDFAQRVTAPDVVKDIVELINILILKSTQLDVKLLKSELAMKVLNREVADAASSFSIAMGKSGGRLLSLLVQRALNYIHTAATNAMTSRGSRDVATRMSLNDISNGFRKGSLFLMNLLLKVALTDITIDILKFLAQVSFQGTATTLGSIINSGIGHHFFVPNFAEAVENVFISIGKYGGKIAANVVEKLLKLIRLGLQQLHQYMSKEARSRMMFGDLFSWARKGVISLTTPKMVNVLQQMIRTTGRDVGYLLSRIFVSTFVKKFINTQLAESLAKAAPTVSRTITELIALVVKSIMNLIHGILTGQGMTNNSLKVKQRMLFSVSSFPAIRGVFEVIFKIIKDISHADNARAIKDFVVIVGRNLGNTMKEILQSGLAHKILQPNFARRLANAAVFIGNRGGQVLGFLIEQALGLFNLIFVRDQSAQGYGFSNIVQRALAAGMNLLRRLTNPNAALILKKFIKDTSKQVGTIIVHMLKSDFVKGILSSEHAAYMSDFIYRMAYTGGEFFGELLRAIMEIIYRVLPQTNSVTRAKRSIQESPQWQILSVAAMKGLRFLQEILQQLTNPSAIARLKNVIATLGADLGKLIANVAQSKYASLVLSKKLSQTIAQFARAVGHQGGKLLGQTVADALTHINSLISYNMKRGVTTRTGMNFYKISSAGAKGLEFIGKVISYISSPESTRLMRDFINIMSADLADLVHDVFRSKLSKRLVGTDLALTLSTAFKEVAGMIGDIRSILLEKVMALIHSLLEKFGISNIKLNDILPRDLLQSLAKLVQQMTEPNVIKEVVELTEMISKRVTVLLVKLIRSNLAAKFLSSRLINILANMASVLGLSGGRIASIYVKKILYFVNSALSSGEVSIRSFNNVGSSLASGFKEAVLFVANLVLKFIDSKSIANIKTFTRYGIAKSLTFVASLINSRIVNTILNKNFVRKLQYGIMNVAKHGGTIIAEFIGKLLEFLVILAQNIRALISGVGTRMPPWQLSNAFPQPGSMYTGAQMQLPSNSLVMAKSLANILMKQINAEASKLFLNMYYFFRYSSTVG